MEILTISRTKLLASLLCGILGCICYGAGDWLMIYGDTAYAGTLYWLTEGTAQITPWRNSLAMLLAFPGILFYGTALFALCHCFKQGVYRTIYHYLTAFGLTPWLCLHLFYVMILFLFAWMRSNGYEASALPAAEALFHHLSWIVLVSEAMMLPPFLYLFYLVISNRSIFPRGMAFFNPLILYAILYLGKSAMPDGAFRIGFTNGLMSESMFLWFAGIALYSIRSVPRVRTGTTESFR